MNALSAQHTMGDDRKHDIQVRMGIIDNEISKLGWKRDLLAHWDWDIKDLDMMVDELVSEFDDLREELRNLEQD